MSDYDVTLNGFVLLVKQNRTEDVKNVMGAFELFSDFYTPNSQSANISIMQIIIFCSPS